MSLSYIVIPIEYRVTSSEILPCFRSPEEADAQAVRVAVLLDELDFPGFGVEDPRTGHIVVEVKTPDASELINYSCSSRVLALPTALMNAHRYLLLIYDLSHNLG